METDVKLVVMLGDHQTGEHADVLSDVAERHGARITEVHTFEPGAPFEQADLTEIEAVATAISSALCTGAGIWLPHPTQDFGREEHPRRISLVLQRHGLDLFLGPHLWPCPTAGGFNEIDLALRREVQAVDELDNAALAIGGSRALVEEIEKALAATPPPLAVRRPTLAGQRTEADFGPGPALPPPTAPWSERHPGLKRFAKWVVNDCGLNQADVARIINAAGHRTPLGRRWQQATISALINGRYDRGAAA